MWGIIFLWFFSLCQQIYVYICRIIHSIFQTMKSILLPLFLICLSIPSYGQAQSNPSSKNQHGNTSVYKTSIDLHGKHNTKGRPKAPSRQNIYCVYEDGNLVIQFRIPEGICQMTVTDLTSGLAFMYTFNSSSEATISVGQLSLALIEIVTENGGEYEGILEI